MEISDSVFATGFFDHTIMDEENLFSCEIDHCLASDSRAGRYRSMNSASWSAKAFVTRPLLLTRLVRAVRGCGAVAFRFFEVRIGMVRIIPNIGLKDNFMFEHAGSHPE